MDNIIRLLMDRLTAAEAEIKRLSEEQELTTEAMKRAEQARASAPAYDASGVYL